jgi:PAS domain S-box-containing protein
VLKKKLLTIDNRFPAQAVGSARLNQFAVDHAVELIMWVNTEGRYVCANQAVLGTLGFEIGELLEKYIWEVIPSMDAGTWNGFLKRLKRKNRAISHFICKTKNDGERSFETVSTYASFDGQDFVFISARETAERHDAKKCRILHNRETSKQNSERNRAAARLRESEDRVRLLLNFTAEAIYAINKDGNCIFCNLACAQIIGGYQPQELIGRNMHELMHHRREHGTPYLIEECPIHMSLLSGESHHGDCETFWRRNGTSFPVEYWCHPIHRDGKEVGAVVTFLDITERHRAEEQIRRLAAIVESSDDAIISMDMEGFVTTWNAGAENMFGYSSAESVGRHINFLAVQGQENGFDEILNTARRGDGVSQFEMQQRSKDGSTLQMSMTASPIRDNSSRIVGVSTITRDITLRRLAGEQIRQLAAIVESSQDAVIGVDLNGMISSWNGGATRMYGYEADDVIGQSMAILAIPGKERDLEETADHILSGDPVRGCETQRRAKDGRILDVSLTLSSMYDPSGKVIGMSSIARNVSSERAIERQYRQAQKMEAVGQLAGGVAHDFNNLLMVVLSCARMILSQGTENSTITKYAELIREAAVRGSTVTTQLLAFSRKQPQNLQTMDLNIVIGQLIKMLSHLLHENVKVEFYPRSPSAIVRMDRAQVELAIMNLAINAGDAMPNGGRLIIETDVASLGRTFSEQHGASIPPGRYVQVIVTDSGTGMDSKTQGRIFEPFYTTKGVGKGTGLGLSTVYGIVKQNHGFVWVYSELGKGTTFKIYVPEVNRDMEAIAPPIAIMQPRQGKETILVAEDQGQLREVLRDCLLARGYRVLTAASGAEALRISQEHKKRIDLFLADVVMPDASGLELGRQILKRHPETRVIFMSGYPHRALDQDGWDSDAKLLQKPFDIETLELEIASILGNPQEGE